MSQYKFHQGELQVQARAGKLAIAVRNSRAIQNRVIPGARPFLKQQNMVLLSSRGADSSLWASIVFGRPGFLSSEDGATFQIDLNQALLDPGDPVWANLEGDGRIGSLIIELSSRRRFRINGEARIEGNRLLKVKIAEAFPACPKYITRRQVFIPASQRLEAEPIPAPDSATLPATLVQNVDAIFIATQSPERGLDVSHRGGSPGFVKATGPHTLRWPDYSGNSMFNTLGNLVQDPSAGLVFADFERNRMVQLTGTAETQWDQPDAMQESGGTNRFVEFTAERWREFSLPAGITTELFDYSPVNPPVAVRSH